MSDATDSQPAIETPIVRLIDDDDAFRRATSRMLRKAGHRVAEYSSVGAMLLEGIGTAPGCLVLDIHMPGPSGLDLQEMLSAQSDPLPVIFVTAEATVHETLRAMKQGAADFFFKPVDGDALLTVVNKSVAENVARHAARRHLTELQNRYARLSARERQVLDMVVNGAMNKQIGAEIGAAERTVKAHRAHVMEKMEATSLADLVRAVGQLGLPAQAPGRVGA